MTQAGHCVRGISAAAGGAVVLLSFANPAAFAAAAETETDAPLPLSSIFQPPPESTDARGETTPEQWVAAPDPEFPFRPLARELFEVPRPVAPVGEPAEHEEFEPLPSVELAVLPPKPVDPYIQRGDGFFDPAGRLFLGAGMETARIEIRNDFRSAAMRLILTREEVPGEIVTILPPGVGEWFDLPEGRWTVRTETWRPSDATWRSYSILRERYREQTLNAGEQYRVNLSESRERALLSRLDSSRELLDPDLGEFEVLLDR